MDYLSTDITNPFFAGYAFECDFKSKIDSIVREYGTNIKASVLTEELIKRGIKPESLTPHELSIIDETFECF